MEISVMKWRGAEVYCLFTGYQYIFQNNFWGILAVAERDGEDNDHFTVMYGNENLVGCSLGGDVCARLAERFISKNEQRYLQKAVTFGREKRDLRRWYIDCNAKEF